MSTRQSITRRDLGRLALGAAAIPWIETPAAAAAAPGTTAEGTFPRGFLWGASTASYQVEGAVKEGGRGLSIWDTFSHRPGKVANNDNGDVTADQYHHYQQDVALMRDLGIKGYRFSVSWSRIFPAGAGAPNPEGLDYYQRLVDALRQAGISPFCTLFHWDLPQALEDKGGWRNRDTAERFADYAGFFASKFSDRIQHFLTTNEIRTFAELGYEVGTHAPGLRLDPQDVAQVKHHGVLAHGLGVQAIRAHGLPGTKVGLAENPTAVVPAVDDAATLHAAEVAMREENAAYLSVILDGRYTDRYLARLGANAPRFTPADLKAISSRLDFVGLNIYNPTYVMAADTPAGYRIIDPSATYPRMLSPWLTLGPEAMYWTPTLTSRLWGVKALYITENGAAADDTLTADGQVLDIERVMFLRNYLNQLQRAIAGGAPVKGYFHWSLLDNFEWADGFGRRFGIVYVDYKTQKRTPKLSAKFYSDVIAQNRVR